MYSVPIKIKNITQVPVALVRRSRWCHINVVFVDQKNIIYIKLSSQSYAITYNYNINLRILCKTEFYAIVHIKIAKNEI